MYTKIGDTAHITGLFGKYDGIIQNPSARFGRNAVNNHINYLQEYHQEPVECAPFEEGDTFEKKVEKVEKFIDDLKTSADMMPPINFKLKYMPNTQKGKVDCDALMGAAFEEMGQKYSIPTPMLDKQLNPEGQDVEIDAYALDLNHDGKVDIGEYSTSILLSDALSNDSEQFSTDNITGTVTNKGENAMLAQYAHNPNNIAYQTYSYLYQFYNLGSAAQQFAQNPNNTFQLLDFGLYNRSDILS